MVVTIYEGYDKSYIIIDSKDERFRKRFGSKVRIPVVGVYGQLSIIASWANNDLGEACLFEVG